MPKNEFLTFFLDPGTDEFEEVLEDAEEAAREVINSTARVANDAAGIMAQVVSKDTWELSKRMRVINSSVSGDLHRHEIGSDAVNRSGKEYGSFEHERHSPNSFFDVGERYANDALWEGAIAEINSI